MALSKSLKENAERNRRYWEEREAEQLKHNITEEKEFNKQLKQIYEDMLDEVQKEIDAFYGKYAKKEGISIAEAKKRVSQADIRAYERKAKRYVKEKDFSKEANEEMRLYNLTMKVNRLEMLKANIGLELIAGHNKLQKFMDKILRGRTEKELKRQAGILGKTVQDNAKAARVIVNASFHNATFSDRIWQYQDLMKNDLSKLLQTALIQGKNPKAVAGELRKYWYGNDPVTGGGAEYCMERLMTTELARVQTEAQKESFIRNGFSQYTFHVNTGCCDICKALNGKHFKVKDMMPGKNAPPVHCWCRCSTSAYEDEDEYEEWLDFLANGGTTAEWNKLKADKSKPSPKSNDKVLEKSDKDSKIEVAGNLKNYDRKSKTYTINEDIKAVNPNHNKGAEYQQNCQRCVPAYELRRRGFDVTAKPAKVTAKGALSRTDKVAQNSGWYNGIFENIKWKMGNAGSGLHDIEKAMKTYGDGSRAEVYVQWKNGGAHVFVAEQVGDKTVFIDPQSGNEDVSHYFNDVKHGATWFARIDNLAVKDLIEECVQNRR